MRARGQPSEDRGTHSWVRDAHPAWGARKIARCLEREGVASRRYRRSIRSSAGTDVSCGPGRRCSSSRFEKPAPNLLWQMDFKGGWRSPTGTLPSARPSSTITRAIRLALRPAPTSKATRCKAGLELTFRRYGLPEAFFVDNGTPWGDASGQRWTRLGVWLLKLGIAVLHSRPTIRRAEARTSAFTAR